MKKYFLLALFSIFLISCGKKETHISGKINNAVPLARMEIIDPSSIATLPLINIGFDDNGNFSENFEIEKDGVYALIYNGQPTYIYLEKGQKLNISGNSSNFTEGLKFSGDGANHSEFLLESQKFITNYLDQLNLDIFAKNETEFINELKKIGSEVSKKLDEIAKEKKANDKVLQWRKDEFAVNILMISTQYEPRHAQLTQKQDFKVSKKYTEEIKKLENESWVKEFPAYRQYLLMQLDEEFFNFALPFAQNPEHTRTELFVKFLETKKELSQETKDYLTSFVATSLDFNPHNPKLDAVIKAVQSSIKNEGIRKDLEKLHTVIKGPKKGTELSNLSLKNAEGKESKISELKGKPTLLVFYSSWANAMEMVNYIVPALKESSEYYEGKLNFAYINLDDDYQQFSKTSQALLKGLKGIHLYADGGLKSEFAKQMQLYGFKLPSFVLIDKEGKIASHTTNNFVFDSDFTQILDKLTGVPFPPHLFPETEETEEHTEYDEHNHKH